MVRVYAITAHSSSGKLAFKSRAIAGSAMLTIVTSTTTMNCPSATAKRAHQRLAVRSLAAVTAVVLAGSVTAPGLVPNDRERQGASASDAPCHPTDLGSELLGV